MDGLQSDWRQAPGTRQCTGQVAAPRSLAVVAAREVGVLEGLTPKVCVIRLRAAQREAGALQRRPPPGGKFELPLAQCSAVGGVGGGMRGGGCGRVRAGVRAGVGGGVSGGPNVLSPSGQRAARQFNLALCRSLFYGLQVGYGCCAS